MQVNEKRRPLVSVLMNCYNGEEHLREALDSVLAQTYQNWELIFWDNQSTDDSRAILEEYLPDERIRYFYSPVHTDLGGGRAAAWNEIRGEYLGILDVDDYWEKEKLDVQLKIMEENPDVGVCISNATYFSESHSEILFKSTPPVDMGCRQLIKRYYITLTSVMLSMKHAKNLDVGFSKDFSHIADFDLIVRLSNVSKIAYTPKVLSGWRVHKNSSSWIENYKFNKEQIDWVNKYFNSSEFSQYRKELIELKERSYLRGMTDFLRRGDIRSAFNLLKNASFHDRIKYPIFLTMYFPLMAILILIRQYRYKKKWWG